jgi:type IV secretory pathway VirB2 component (pilin)
MMQQNALPLALDSGINVKRNEALMLKAMFFLFLMAVAVFPEFAAAQTNPVENFLNGLIGFLTSGVMRSIAIIAVFACGVAAYLGRISWELVMKIGGGIILTFGGAAIVDQFSGYV